MARIEDAPQIIIKYTMGTRIPNVGVVRGLYTRVYFDYWIKRDRLFIADTPLRREDALAFIEKYGLVPVAEDADTKIWDTPDGAFREYAREHKVSVPPGIGTNTICENIKELIDYEEDD